MRSAQRHKGGARRAGDSRGAECAVGLIPHQAAGLQAVMFSGKTNNVRNGPKADTRTCREQELPCRDKVTLEPFRVCSGLANGHRALGRSQQLLLLLEFPVQLVAAAEVLFRPVDGA